MYRYIDHTADIGLEVESDTLDGLFVDAAIGLTSLVFDIEKINEEVQEVIELEAMDIESLLVRWLNELIHKCFVERKVFKRFRVSVDEHSVSLKASISGQKYTAQPHTEIKSATYHNLNIKKSNGYSVEIIFDV